MSAVEQTTYGPVLWSRAVPKTGGALGILAQPCLSFIRSPAHHAQPFQRMQNTLDFQRSRTCLISMTFETYLNTLKNKNIFKHTNVRFAELCQENNDSFSLQLLEVNNRDRQCTHLHCQLAVIFYSMFFLNNQALIQDIWLIKLRPSAAVLSPADLHCLKSVTCFGTAVSHCLFLCQLFHCKSAPFTRHTVPGLCLPWWPFLIAIVLDNLYQNTGHVQKPVIQQTVRSMWTKEIMATPKNPSLTRTLHNSNTSK